MANSSVVTGGVTITAAMLVPFVSWALAGFAPPVPETVPYLLAAAIITVAHGTYNLVMACLTPKDQPPKV